MAQLNESNCVSNFSEVVELGFLEKVQPWLLKSKFFRCKVGGKPAWLSLENLPEAGLLQCKNCKKPYSFLLQVYAPIDGLEEAFHRTIYVFMCIDGKCCKKFNASNFTVFRTQLPRRNQYYDFDPPTETEVGSDQPSASQYNQLCDVCGCKSVMNCEKCEKKNYCSESHKLMDYEMGHNDLCCVETSNENLGEKKKKKKKKLKVLLPEYELVTDTEVLRTQQTEKSDEEKMKEYKQFLQSGKASSCIQEGQFDGIENLMKKPDKLFNKFQKRVALEPEQVLRYQRGGIPLWVSSEHKPKESDIPNCTCGAKRVFEFQVMPQLLNHLSLDDIGESVDWGTIIIYTCSKSCSLGTSAYVQEFVWKQDFSEDREQN